MEWLLWLLIALAFGAVFGGQGKKPPQKQRQQQWPDERPVEHRQAEHDTERPASSVEDYKQMGDKEYYQWPEQESESVATEPVQYQPVQWPEYSWEKEEQLAESSAESSIDTIATQAEYFEEQPQFRPEQQIETTSPLAQEEQTDKTEVETVGQSLSYPTSRKEWRAAFVASIVFGPPRSVQKSGRGEFPWRT